MRGLSQAFRSCGGSDGGIARYTVACLLAAADRADHAAPVRDARNYRQVRVGRARFPRGDKELVPKGYGQDLVCYLRIKLARPAPNEFPANLLG